MTRERALEIIGAYGAAPARWPDTERAAVLALAHSDPAVHEALAAAGPLDTLLCNWALDVPVQHFDADALLPAPRALPGGGILRTSVMRWVAGGTVAAGLALALVVMPSGSSRDAAVVVAQIDSVSPVSAGDAAELDDSFAMFFTPTADEEDVI